MRKEQGPQEGEGVEQGREGGVSLSQGPEAHLGQQEGKQDVSRAREVVDVHFKWKPSRTC